LVFLNLTLCTDESDIQSYGESREKIRKDSVWFAVLKAHR
jgi:hypothetical protein